MAFALILALISMGWIASVSLASEPMLVTFSGKVIDDEGMPASTTIRAYLVDKVTRVVHELPFATGTSTVENGQYVLRDTSIYGDQIDISGLIEDYDFLYKINNVGVSGGETECWATFTPGSSIIRDFQITTHGIVNVHIKDTNGNNAPSGVPMWFSYVGPYGYDDPNWPDNAPPSDGVSPKQVTDSSGVISMKLNASWTFDGGSLGGFIYAYPAGYRNYGGALQTSSLRYDWTDMADVSAHAGKTVDYTIQVTPLGQIVTRLEDSVSGEVISGANISYLSTDSNDTSNQYNINKYHEGSSVYALGPVTIRANDPDNPGNNHLGHNSAEQTASPIPWGLVPVTLNLDPHGPGVISGRVYDTSERPLVGATVELLWDDWGGEGGLEGGHYTTIRQATTDANGSYQFMGVVSTSGQGYVLRANKTLYRASLQGDIYVDSDETTNANNFFLSPVSSIVTINPSTFSVGQSATVTAQVKDAAGNSVADGTEVTLATNRGILTSGENTEQRINGLVSNGQFTAQLSSDTAGLGAVNLNNGEAVGTFEVTSPAPSTSETMTVTNPSTTGFTVELSPSLAGLTASNFTLLDSSSQAVSITGATTTDSGATYAIRAGLSAGQTYTVTAAKSGYNFGSGHSVVVPAAASSAAEPTINTQPSNQTVNVGGTANLSIAASGGVVLSYQWYSNPVNSTTGGAGQSVCIATGNNFPVALAGSVYANHNASIILADGSLSDQVMNYLKNKELIGATLFGGEAAVSKDIEQQLGQLIGK